MRVALAFLKRDFLIAVSYKADFLFQLAGIFGTVPAFYFLSRLYGGGAHLPARYGNDYFSFMLIGVAFTDYLVLSLKTFNTSLRESQLMGTLETILLSPTRIRGLLLYSSVWGYVLTTLRFVLYLAAGLLFGLRLEHANAPAAIAILLLAVASFAGLGILIATVTLVTKRGELLVTGITALSGLLCGVLFPVELLPRWLQRAAAFIPMTHALEGLRMALVEGQPTARLLPQFQALALFALVLLPAGLLSFSLAIRWAKTSGTLAQY